jgi:hypothetical protein
VEPCHCLGACGFGFVVHEGAVALGDEEDALNLLSSIPGEMILEVCDVGAGRKVADPKCVARLFGFPWGPSWYRISETGVRTMSTKA